MKRLLLLHILLAMQVVAFGCDVCKKQQPKVLRGITHGAGPQSDWDYVIVGITALIVLVSLFYSIRWIIRPGEKESTHIKNAVLNFN
jgi:hypothetical protein